MSLTIGWATAAVAVLLQAAAGPPQRVEGRVVRPAAKALVPVAGVPVTLHRVGPDTAGPIDSARTDAQGRFHFTYHRTGSSEAIYFVSSMYDGIAYFSQPLKTALVSGDDGEITVFDTTSAAVPMTVRGRHLIVSAPGTDGARTVIEVFEISNDTSVTRITPGSADRPTWTSILPAGTQHFQPGQGDVAADAITAADGRVEVFAPFAPGIKQLTYQYMLPSGAFPLHLPLERQTSVLELLVEEPTATVRVAGVREVNPVSVQGRTFRRFMGQDLPSSAVVDIAPPAMGGDARSLYFTLLLGAVGAAMLVALARAYSRRPQLAASMGRASWPGEGLAAAIADLDDGFARRAAPTGAEREAYSARRSALKAQLTTVLSEGTGRPD